MIKKKSPILMVSIVGTLLVSLIAFNMTQYLRRPGGLQEIEAPNKEALEKIRNRQREIVGPGGASLAELKSRSGFGPASVEGDATVGTVPDVPSIQVPNSKQYVPTFDSSTISSQWYDDDSYQKVNAKKNEGKREEPSEN